MICIDCEDEEAIKGKDLCPQCERDRKYLDKFIREESLKQGRFCKQCGKPIEKGKQLCEEHRLENRANAYGKYAGKTAAERTAYWKKYQKPAKSR